MLADKKSGVECKEERKLPAEKCWERYQRKNVEREAARIIQRTVV
jgi:hypothetical protein